MRKLFTFLCAALMSVGMFATTYTVTFTNLNNVVKVVENITLPHTFSCDYTNGNGELDLIIQETYNETGGRCSTTRQWPWGGTENEVVVGHDGNNHFVTINAPFVGTSFMSGYYDGSSFGEFYYSFHITIAAAEPEPTTYTLQLVADPEKGSVEVTNLLGSDIIDNGNGNYTVPENAEVTILATPLEGFEFTGWKVGNIEEMVGCYYCGTALNTEDNPYTFTMTADVAYLAEFEREINGDLVYLAVNLPTENRPADDKIEVVGTFQFNDGVIDLEKLESGWFIYNNPEADDYPLFYASADDTFKLRDKANNDMVLCKLVDGEWVQAILKFGDAWEYEEYGYKGGDPCMWYENDLSDASQYAWKEGMPEPDPEGIEHVVLNVKQAKKVVVDGQLYIVREGKLFNVAGAQVR